MPSLILFSLSCNITQVYENDLHNKINAQGKKKVKLKNLQQLWRSRFYNFMIFWTVTVNWAPNGSKWKKNYIFCYVYICRRCKELNKKIIYLKVHTVKGFLLYHGEKNRKHYFDCCIKSLFVVDPTYSLLLLVG